MAGTEVVLGGVTVPIEAVREGDRVLASDVPEADTADEAWVEVTPSSKPRPWAGALCERVKRWARTAAVPAALLAACDVAELPAVDEVVQVYDARTGTWSKALGAELEVGDTFVQAGQVFRVTEDGVEVRGDAALRDLADADRTWVAEAAHRVPGGDDWVLVLGDADKAGHWRLSEVQPGARFAFGGRVFETTDADGDGLVEVRATGDVLGEVVDTFVRVAPEVIDAEIVYADGNTDTLVGTPNHPFWVDAVRDYVPLGRLEIGTELHVQGGGEAVLVSKTWRQGDFEVFDLEVLAGPGRGLHNFYVRGEGSDAAGVLVHNSTGKGSVTGYRAVEPGELADIEATGAFRTGPSGEMGKGFFTSDEAASSFAEGMSKQGNGPFTTVKTEIPDDVAKRSASYSPASEGDALFIDEDDLSGLVPDIQDTMAVPK